MPGFAPPATRGRRRYARRVISTGKVGGSVRRWRSSRDLFVLLRLPGYKAAVSLPFSMVVVPACQPMENRNSYHAVTDLQARPSATMGLDSQQ